MRLWILAGTLAVALCGAATADDIGAGEVPIPAPEAAEPELAVTPPATAAPIQPYTPHDGRSAIDAWDEMRDYRYGTDMIFPLTRGMEEAGISGWARWPMTALTVPLDLVMLPTGLIAGLYGS
ncbi:MAG: hypothetical protein JRH16_02170 [Deltaproteobacteria bacterium]|nr:hypothetical protein [Deltaproteobacteria bacterium]MBW2360538.1 hypothetical protein [Deltaproteobacteria bacterium]